MSARYKITSMELEAVSEHDFAEATNAAIADAAKAIPKLSWFEVRSLGGRIKDGKRSEYRVRFAVGE